MKKARKSKSWDTLKKKPVDVIIPEIPKGIPTLVLTGYAYQKLAYWESLSGHDEVSCFGIALHDERPLRINELYLPDQEVTTVSTDPTEEGLAKMHDECGLLNLNPRQFSRVWIHTHPFKSSPSQVDYTTCREQFATYNWFVMLIKGNDGFTCYLYIMGDLPVRLTLKVEIDYTNPGLPSNIMEAWTKTFKEGVSKPIPTVTDIRHRGYSGFGICRDRIVTPAVASGGSGVKAESSHYEGRGDGYDFCAQCFSRGNTIDCGNCDVRTRRFLERIENEQDSGFYQHL